MGGGWAEVAGGVDPVVFEGWLAAAGGAHEAARTLFDIAARSGPGVPAAERLTGLPREGLRELLGGSREDAVAAVYEWVRRSEGVGLRWTQLAASDALAGGEVVNMAAGEGKSWLFLVDAARQAVAPGTGAVQVITTRGNLADREFERYGRVLSPLGFDVHRMNPDSPPPPPAGGGRRCMWGRARMWGSRCCGRAWCRARTRPGGCRRGSTRRWMRWMRRSCIPTRSTSCRRGCRAGAGAGRGPGG